MYRKDNAPAVDAGVSFYAHGRVRSIPASLDAAGAADRGEKRSPIRLHRAEQGLSHAKRGMPPGEGVLRLKPDTVYFVKPKLEEDPGVLLISDPGRFLAAGK